MKAKSAVGLELALQLVLVTAWPSRSGGRQWCTSLLCHQGAWELSQDMALLSLLILCGSFIPSSILRFLTGTCSTKKKKKEKKKYVFIRNFQSGNISVLSISSSNCFSFSVHLSSGVAVQPVRGNCIFFGC